MLISITEGQTDITYSRKLIGPNVRSVSVAPVTALKYQTSVVHFSLSQLNRCNSRKNSHVASLHIPSNLFMSYPAICRYVIFMVKSVVK
jgi:hypothetical protein